MSAARPLLVVAAWEPELAALHARLGPARARASAGVITRAVGVGLVEAAAGTAAVLAELRPAALVLVGTAGAYPGVALAPPVAVVIRRAHLASASVAGGAAYLPAPLPGSVDTDARLRRALQTAADRRLADVACPLGITKRAATARRLAAATGAALENLEAFAVLRAAAAARIPAAAVLGVANVVGPRAHAEWRAHGPAAAAAACTVVERWLAR